MIYKLKKVISFILVILMILSFLPKSTAYAKEDNNILHKSSEQVFKNALMEEKNKHVITNHKDDTIVRLIVSTDDLPKIKSGVDNNYSSIKDAILKIAPEAKFKQEFDYLVSGFSLDVAFKHVREISALKGVRKVSIAREFYPTMTDAVAMTQAKEFWQNQNYKGEGMVISIIDTGIDIDHKDMRLTDPSKAKIQNVKTSSDTTFSMKVPYGYNYADGNDIVKDDIKNSMHGMHVAGIVAANSTDQDLEAEKGIRGVAPEAQLLAMKVFSNNNDMSEAAYEDGIVKAIEDSVSMGADIINMSLGSDNGFNNPDDPEQVAIKNAVEAGVIVVVSAGNAAMSTTKNEHSRILTNDLNLKDNAAIGSPSTSEYAISVASMNNKTHTGYIGHTDGNLEFIYEEALHHDKLEGNRVYPLVFVNIGDEYDYLQNGNQIDLTGKIALILRGDISFQEKIKRAAEHNAVGVIIANNEDGSFGMAGIENETIPAVTVSKDIGELLQSKTEVQFKIKNDYTGSWEVSSFTSYGPTPELDFKPDIMAPGGNINSTLNNNNYGKMSGTSMAAPHVAGAMALLVGNLKKENFSGNLIDFAKKSIVNTAQPLKDIANGSDLYVSPRRQGAGAIFIENAMKNRVIITGDDNKPTKALKEISGIVSFNINLENLSSENITYNLDLSPVLTEKTDSDSKKVSSAILSGASISVDKQIVTVPAKGKAQVIVTLDVTNAESQQFAEGFIQFKSDTAPTLGFPYMGFVGDWGKETVLDKPKSDPDSKYDVLGLTSGSSYLGSEFNIFTMSETVNQDRVGFSPNDDNNMDSINLVLGLLRSAQAIKMDIVKEAEDTSPSLIHINTTDRVIKPSYSRKNPVNYFNGFWDGKIFNPIKGEYEVIEDGKYYVKITATVESKFTKEQTTYLPFKVDTTKPELEIISQEWIGDEYVIKFKASDKGIGLASDGVGAYVDDEEKEDLSESSTPGVYEYRIARNKIDDAKTHTVTIGAIDDVFNVKTKTIVLNDVGVSFYNVSDKIINRINRYLDSNLSDYTILGYAGDDVSTIEISGVSAQVEDNTFELKVPLEEGRNELTFVAKNSSGQTVNQGPIVLEKDVIPPILNITKPDISKTVVVNDFNVPVEGTAIDASGKPIIVWIGQTTKVEAGQDGNFSGIGKVDWSRVMKVRAIDAAGNETVQSIRVVVDKDDEEFKLYTTGISSLEFVNDESNIVENGKLMIKGNITKPVKELLIDGVSVHVNDDLTFSHEYPLKEVNNHFTIKAIGLDDSVLLTRGYSIYYDKTAPNVSFSPEVGEDNVIYTNQNPYEVSGIASDNGQGYRLFVNGNEVASFDSTASKGEESNSKKFKIDVDSTTGNTLLIEMIDSFSNKTVRRYTFNFDDVAPVINIGNIKNGKLEIGSKLEIEITDNKDTSPLVEMSLNGDEYNGETITEPGTYSLIVRAKDKAGNVTEKTIEFRVEEKYTITAKTLTLTVGESIDLMKAINVLDSKFKSVSPISVVPKTKLPTEEGTHKVEVEVTLPNGNREIALVTIVINTKKVVDPIKPKDPNPIENNKPSSVQTDEHTVSSIQNSGNNLPKVGYEIGINPIYITIFIMLSGICILILKKNRYDD